MKTNREVSTKLDARAESQKTALTLNWEGMTPDDIRALAEQALVVKLQGKWRADKAIPAEAEVNVVEHKVGTRAARKPTDVLALVKSGALTEEQKAELRALLAK